MNDEERQELRELVGDQVRLLIAVAENPDLAEELEAEYLDRHREIRSRVAPLPCFCAAASLMPWKYTPHPDAQHELDEMRAPLAELLTDIPAKRWREPPWE